MHSLNRVAILAAMLATLTIGPLASADYAGLWLTSHECEAPGLPGHRVWRVYARFSNVGDRLVSVFGSAASPVTVTATAGFYQHPAAGNTAPDASLVAKVPATQWDTFCTIGLARETDGNDHTITSPGFPQLPVINNTSMFWGTFDPALPQCAPNAAGQVMILQLTLPPGSGITQCQVGLVYRLAGSPTNVTVHNASVTLLPLTSGDVNGDLLVNIDDLVKVILTWGPVGPGSADPNDDGVVDVDDLLLVILHWGMFPGSCS